MSTHRDEGRLILARCEVNFDYIERSKTWGYYHLISRPGYRLI